MSQERTLRNITKTDASIISQAFKEQGWEKPISQYENYLFFQNEGSRDIIIAEYEGQFAGYLTIKWKSDYPSFQQQKIPEIVDFNVLKKFQRKGIGTLLMDEAEARIAKLSARAGIGFGLYSNYGAAQILYVKRGYIPDGNGLVYDFLPLKYGEQAIVDDSLVLYLTKSLADTSKEAQSK